MRRLALVCVLALACSVGCNESTLIRPGVTNFYFQNPPTEVDILLVVDDSCSMADEQEELGEGFDRFVEFFDVADVDYHIGIITTDMDSFQRSGRLVDAGGEKVIDRHTDDADDVFRENVNVGTDGWGFEKGLDAAAAALGEDLTEGFNEGFLREDALLSVIFVSDEEDISEYGVNSYINFFRNLKDDARQRDTFNASALIGVDEDSLEPEYCGQSALDPYAGAAPGFRYHDVAVQTGGVVGSICSNDFADIVNEMGLASSRLISEFLLDRRPREDSLEMTVFVPDSDSEEDGIGVPPEGLEDGDYAWEYVENEEDEEYVVRFTDITLLPPIDTKIVLHYELF